MKNQHEIAKILVDTFEENGISTEGISFYDMMFFLFGDESYDLVVKALSNDVIAKIKEAVA